MKAASQFIEYIKTDKNVRLAFLVFIMLSSLAYFQGSDYTQECKPKGISMLHEFKGLNVTDKVGQPVLVKDESETFILHFTSSNCNLCKIDKPILEDLVEKYEVPMYGIISYANDKEVDDKEASFYTKIYFDLDGKALKSQGGSSIPETIIIHDNKVVFQLHGPLTNEIYTNEVSPLLNSLTKCK